MDLKNIRSKAGDILKKYRYVWIVLLIGIGLMLIPDVDKKSDSPTVAASVGFSDPTEDLTEILSAVQGAGKVRVFLTLQAQERTVYQTDRDLDSNGGVSDQTIIITDVDRNQQGMVQQILAPEYRGAIVLCQGAGDAAVRLAIVEAVADATGLSTDRISVLKMK